MAAEVGKNGWMTTSAPRSRAADPDAARTSGSAAGLDPTAGGDRRVRRILAWIIDLLPVAALFFALWVAGSDVLESRAGACDPAPAPDCNVLEQTDRLDEAGNVVIEFTLVDGRVIDSDHTTFEFFGTVYIADPPTLSSYLVTLAYVLLVFVGVQGTTGWTPGKLVTGLRLADESRRTPGVGRALLRWALPDGALGVVGVVAAVVGAVWPMRLFALFGALGIVRFLGELVPAAAGPFGDRRIGVRVIARDDFIGGRPDHGAAAPADGETSATVATADAAGETPAADGLIDQVPMGPTTPEQHRDQRSPEQHRDQPAPDGPADARAAGEPVAATSEATAAAVADRASVEAVPTEKAADPVGSVAITEDADAAETVAAEADAAEMSPVTPPAVEPTATLAGSATTPDTPPGPEPTRDEPAAEPVSVSEPEPGPSPEPGPVAVTVSPDAGEGPITLPVTPGDGPTSVESEPPPAADADADDSRPGSGAQTAAATDQQTTVPAAGPAAITEDEDEDTTFTELAAAMTGATSGSADTGPADATADATSDDADGNDANDAVAVVAGPSGGDESGPGRFADSPVERIDSESTVERIDSESTAERIDSESTAQAVVAAAADDQPADTAAATTGAATADNPYKPQWDNARRAYICWEPVSSEWLQWDDAAKAWGPISR
jgi:hypothetical protein